MHPPHLGGTWTLLLSEFGLRSRILVAQADSAITEQPLGFPALQRVAIWANLRQPPIARNVTLAVSLIGPVMTWRLDQGDAQVAFGEGRVFTDPVHRVPRAKGDGVFLWQGSRVPIKFDAFQGLPLPPPVRRDSTGIPRVIVLAPGVVTLRMDDCRATDAQAFEILQRLRLVAEVAVPTAWVGQRGSCDWALVRTMASAGNSIESHSRTHGATPRSFGEFYLETVGSLLDLRAQGYDPKIFIQPGNWSDSYAHMDAPWKLDTPYGALLSRVYVGVEAYYRNEQSIPFPWGGSNGAAHVPIGVFTPASLDGFLRNQAAQGRWVHLAWHSFMIKPEELEARLKVVAALRDAGVVAVIPYQQALFAGRPAVPPLNLAADTDTIP